MLVRLTRLHRSRAYPSMLLLLVPHAGGLELLHGLIGELGARRVAARDIETLISTQDGSHEDGSHAAGTAEGI